MQTILIIVTKAEIGGAQQFVLTLAKGLTNLNWKVIVGCGEHGFLENELVKEQISFHIFKHLDRSFNPFKSLLFILELYSFIKKNKVCLVHLNSTNTLAGVISAKLAKIKSVTTIHGLSFADPHQVISKLELFTYQMIYKVLLRFMDQVVFVSKQNQKYAEKIGLVKKGITIYNGINIDQSQFIPREEARKFIGNKAGVSFKEKYIVGSIGRYAYPKNYEFLINNFDEIKKLIPNALLILIGEGPDRKKYEEKIKKQKNGHEIILIGEIYQAAKYIKAIDLFILPSVYEGFPLSILEACKASIPILATEVGGIPEILHSQYLFSHFDKDDFLKKIQFISKGSNRSCKIEPSDTKQMISNYVQIYTKMQ
jgi:glycosyltransferase involved in cell wall biosynthesis